MPHPPPSPPQTPEVVAVDSPRPLPSSGTGTGRNPSILLRPPSPDEYTPLVDLMSLIPKVRYIAAPSTSAAIAIPDTARSDSPLRLLFGDLVTFVWTVPYFPYALSPVRSRTKRHPDGSKHVGWIGWAGDSGNWRTRRDDTLVSLASLIQLVSLPVLMLGVVVLPGFVFAAFMGVLWAVNWLILIPLRGPRVIKSAECEDEQAVVNSAGSDERWFFINGVMTSCHGVQAAVNNIARTFRRPVTGIHNWTNGFFGDIGECLVQRVFGYSTLDGRIAYDYIRASLIDPDVRKVVIMAHSQGGIVASLILDKLLTDLPHTCLGKLEIFTFGSAASHFSNPLTSLPTPNRPAPPLRNPTEPLLSQSVAIRQSSTRTTHASSSDRRHHSYSKSNPLPRPHHLHRPSRVYIHQTRSQSDSSLPPSPQDHSRQSIQEPTAPPIERRTLPYIEHYVNEYDPVPRWGVLHSLYNLLSPRYAGRVFIRLGASGHLFSKHYLSALFPPDEGERRLFWDREVVVDEDLEERRREKAKEDLKTRDGNEDGTNKSVTDIGAGGKGMKVWELGRLWGYVDGGVPDSSGVLEV